MSTSPRAHADYWKVHACYGDDIPTSSISCECEICGTDFRVFKHNKTRWHKVTCCSPECLKVATKRDSFTHRSHVPVTEGVTVKCSNCGATKKVVLSILMAQKYTTCKCCGYTKQNYGNDIQKPCTRCGKENYGSDYQFCERCRAKGVEYSRKNYTRTHTARIRRVGA